MARSSKCVAFIFGVFAFFCMIFPLQQAHAQGCSPNTTVSLSSQLGNAQLCGTTDNGTTVYRGIPYAAPPVGALRWQAPQALTASSIWNGTLQATQFAPICPQSATSTPNQSEDCLYLNVWVPSGATSTSKLPVMVFIHGGAFVTGAGSLDVYNGSVLASNAGNPAIVVTLNYRLGALGFLYANVNGFPAPANANLLINGNFGLRDQQLALQWVQQNIAGFGGNPSNVTLFGESAGAMSVGLHLTSIPSSNATYSVAQGSGTLPPNVSLFQKAIMESNPYGLPYRDVSTAAARALNPLGLNFLQRLCALLNQQDSTTPAKYCWAGANPIAFLQQKVPLKAILTAQSDVSGASFATNLFTGGLAAALPWAPVYDNSFVVNQPLKGYYSATVAQGAFKYTVQSTPMPVLLGFNQNEGATFAGLAEAANPTVLTNATYPALLSVAYKASSTAIQKVPAYNATQMSASAPPYYFSSCNPKTNPVSCTFPLPSCSSTDTTTNCTGPGNGGAFAFSNLTTDDIFKCANLQAANAYVGRSTNAVYGYLFASPPILNLYGTLPSCSATSGNVCHGNELPYVFGTVGNFAYPVPPADSSVSQAMVNAWLSFAAKGSPGISAWSPLSSSNQSVYTLGGTNNGQPSEIATSSNCTSLWNTIYPLS